MADYADCPRCGYSAVIPHGEPSTPLECTRCRLQFTPNRPIPVLAVAGSSALEDLEAAIRRMITGLFVFVFVRLPCWVYDLFARLFASIRDFFHWLVPTLVKVVRVAFLFAFWLAIVFAPVVIAAVWLRRPWALALGGGWSTLALIGSLWGAVYYVRKRKALHS